MHNRKRKTTIVFPFFFYILEHWEKPDTVCSWYWYLCSWPGSPRYSPPTTWRRGWRWSSWSPPSPWPPSFSVSGASWIIRWLTGSKEHIWRTRLEMLFMKTAEKFPVGRRPMGLQRITRSLKESRLYQNLSLKEMNICKSNPTSQSYFYALKPLFQIVSIPVFYEFFFTQLLYQLLPNVPNWQKVKSLSKDNIEVV